MITKQQVIHIAKLARLGLKEKEIEKMQKELSLILDYFDKLKEADVSKVDSVSSKFENVFREDFTKTKEIEEKKKLFGMAPEKKENYFKVKSILK
ncbi:glutamyl-tRNA amidotransferase [Parcubacteria bacterium DG_74_2]|nr:MAG: glutamyl-tRNA amidotransferase [Parcubacteria bacterium DG_74_2]